MNKEEFISKFENYVDNNPKESIWKSYIELEKITGYDIHWIIGFLENPTNWDTAIQNKHNKFSTRKMYEKHTTIWNKIKDSMSGDFN